MSGISSLHINGRSRNDRAVGALGLGVDGADGSDTACYAAAAVSTAGELLGGAIPQQFAGGSVITVGQTATGESVQDSFTAHVERAAHRNITINFQSVLDI